MTDQDDVAGRTCPLRYRYGATALASASEKPVDTLYVVGGLYGNPQALDALDAVIAAETGPVTVCFNGDFNWFNVDDAGFSAINRRVLAHDAILGNVEAELAAEAATAGCGCAYPIGVDDAVVERSNRIHARLKATAARHPEVIERLSQLPMFARYRVGDAAVGVVHGDADALAGWHFDVASLDDPARRGWIDAAFAQARVDVFASTHTCLPALRHFGAGAQRKVVVNNGAAGMPNFAGQRSGLMTRISVMPSPVGRLYGTRLRDCFIDAVPLAYDPDAWDAMFRRNWPPGSPADQSYAQRISGGPAHTLAQAFWGGDVI